MNEPKTVKIVFDGGTPCNVPSRGYGEGYGSFTLNGQRPWRLQFGEPMSANAAEIRTLICAIRVVLLVESNPHNVILEITGDSQIALGRCHKGRKPPKGSGPFVRACEELLIVCSQFHKVRTKWHKRERSVELFGH